MRISTLFLGFIMTVQQSYGLDKDEYLTDLYNTLYQGDYSTLSEKVNVAVDAWNRRMTEAQNRNSAFGRSRYGSSSSHLTPQDESAIKLGPEFCESNYNYWKARQAKVRKLNDASDYYRVHIQNILNNEVTKELIEGYPSCTSSHSSDGITQEYLYLLKNKTIEAWETHLKELKASFFRTIKAERSELFCQDNGYIVGSVFSSFSSLYRKTSRLYNWEESINDSGTKFEEYYKIFEVFKSYYKDDSKHLFIICPYYPLQDRARHLEDWLFVINQVEKQRKEKAK